MQVAISGAASERRDASLLWGLYACDAGSAAAAIQAFAVAAPDGGLGRLAARRLEEALSRGASAALWQRAAESSWLTASERADLRVGAAERFVGSLSDEHILQLLPKGEDLSAGLRLRVLAVRGRLGGGERQLALREVARDFPQRFRDLFPGEDEQRVAASLSVTERLERAAALRAAGRSLAALREASALGPGAAEVAARAALDLRRSQTAERWSRRMGDSPTGLLLLAEAERQQAWSSRPPSRAERFGRVATTAGRLSKLAAGNGELRAQADLLQAEALAEMGSYGKAAALLGNQAVRKLPRWEWVWRRLIYLQGRRGQRPVGGELGALSESTRGRRLAAYWQAATASGSERVEALSELATSGVPDLPGLWAARELGRRGVPVELSDTALVVPEAPAWAAHLLQLGRVSDVIVAWREELAAGESRPEEWISLVQLADYPTIDAVPLLLRGEPRLLVGPWSGLPRALLEAYLPLPWRAEVEAAARTADMAPWVLAGIVRQESAWNPRARSPAGALGLTQVLPSTAPDIARWSGRKDLIGRSLFDPEVNLVLGALHTAGWYRDYGSWTVALACHNAGERRVREAWLAAGRSDGPGFVESLEIPETWDYVHRVVLWSEGYRLLYWPDGEAYPWT